MKPNATLSRRLGLGLLGLVLLLALGFVVMRSGPLAPTRVTVTQAAQGRLKPALFGLGTVEARRAYQVGPTLAGRVKRVAVDVGDLVKAGQVLVEMDPVDLDERLAAADAALARAGSVVAGAQAQLTDAASKRELANINARRYADLGAQKFVSAGVVEAKLQEQLSAAAVVSGAEANLGAARQDLQRQLAERAGLRQQRDKLRLLAASDGVVIGRDAEAGSTVLAGQAVLRLIEPASLWVKVRFDQGRSAGLAEGLRAEIVLRSKPAAPLPGSVARVEAVSDSVTEERSALITFDQLPVGLAVGELAEVTLALPPTASSLLLPNASIKRHLDVQGVGVGVWRLDGDALRFVPVRTGQTSLDGQVQILDGLKAGDSVVVFSEKALQAGSRVKVVERLTGSRP